MYILDVSRLNIKKIVKKTNGLDRFLITMVLIGAIVSGISFFRGILVDRKIQVEYLNNNHLVNNEAETIIFIDIEGAVINPGVYELPENSRIKDAVISAGGLANDADREFCEKNLNMAEKLKDGQKIYIPSINNTDAQQGYYEAMLSSKKININKASLVELDTLWGIGTARAESIVKNRPYQDVDELISKGVLTKSTFDRNKELLTVY